LLRDSREIVLAVKRDVASTICHIFCLKKKMAITNHMLFDKQEANSMPLRHDRDRDWWVFFFIYRPWKRI